jgi:hypothetical protein
VFHVSSPLYTAPLGIAAVGAANVAVVVTALSLLAGPGSAAATDDGPSARSAPVVAVAMHAETAPQAVRAPTPPPRAIALRRVRAATVRPPKPERTSAVRFARSAAAPALPVPKATDASSWSSALTAAIRRIPGYRPGAARWVVSSAYGSWGTADWYRGIVYVSPRVPRSRLYDVVSHEWSHLLSVRPYANDVDTAMASMNAYFGGPGLAGAERAADCMALLLGAGWTHYTPCTSSVWRAGAARLLRGEKL